MCGAWACSWWQAAPAAPRPRRSAQPPSRQPARGPWHLVWPHRAGQLGPGVKCPPWKRPRPWSVGALWPWPLVLPGPRARRYSLPARSLSRARPGAAGHCAVLGWDRAWVPVPGPASTPGTSWALGGRGLMSFPAWYHPEPCARPGSCHVPAATQSSSRSRHGQWVQGADRAGAAPPGVAVSLPGTAVCKPAALPQKHLLSALILSY